MASMDVPAYGVEFYPTAAPSVVPRYVNTVKLQMSPWDVTLEFSHLYPVAGETETTNEVASEVVARLTMSPHPHGRRSSRY